MLLPFAIAFRFRSRNCSGVPFAGLLTHVLHSDAEDEQTLTAMGRTNFRRFKQAARTRETCFFQVSGDVVESLAEMPSDVLEKHDGRFTLADHSQNIGPQMSRIFSSKSFTSTAPGLARVSRSDEIHAATPRLRVEGLEIRPHRERSHDLCFHRLRQVVNGVGFPLDTADSASAFNRQFKPELQSPAAGAE